MKCRVSQEYGEHLLHPNAGGWRCWTCPKWSEGRLQGRCAVFVDVSLSYVSGNRRRSTGRRAGAE
jgi:hypothetical protein